MITKDKLKYLPFSNIAVRFSKKLTPALVTIPRVGDRLVWMELYRAGAYPKGKDGTDDYYKAATISLI